MPDTELPPIQTATNLSAGADASAKAPPKAPTVTATPEAARAAAIPDPIERAVTRDFVKEASDRMLAKIAKATEASDAGEKAPRKERPAKADAKAEPKADAKPAAVADADAGDEGDDDETPYREEGATTDEGDEEGRTEDAGEGEGEGDDEQGEAAAEGDEDGEEDAAAKATVVLKGHPERGETDLELDVQDPAVADRLRRLQNDAMRGKEVRERTAELNARQAALDEIHLVADTNPVAFALEVVPQEHRLAVAEALIVEHWDALQPKLTQFFEDAAAVPKAQAEMLRDARTKDSDTAKTRANVQRAAEIRTAVFTLVPDGVEPELRAQFLKDAERDVVEAISTATGPIGPAQVPGILARRLRMYGFATAEAASEKKQGSTSVTVARPVSDRAKAIVTKAEVEKSQTRRKEIQRRRSHAQAIPPGGRGSAAAVKPLVPKGSSIEDASKAVIRSGADTWDGFRSRVPARGS